MRRRVTSTSGSSGILGQGTKRARRRGGTSGQRVLGPREPARAPARDEVVAGVAEPRGARRRGAAASSAPAAAEAEQSTWIAASERTSSAPSARHTTMLSGSAARRSGGHHRAERLAAEGREVEARPRGPPPRRSAPSGGRGRSRRRRRAGRARARCRQAAHALPGSTRIFAWASGSRSVRNASATPSMPTRPVTSGLDRELALGEGAQRAGELVGRVAEHELERELLVDAEHRLDAVDLHADAGHHDARARAARRASARRSCPGTPDALEDERLLRAGGLRQASTGCSCAGSTTTSAPRCSARRATLRREVGGHDRADALQAERGDHGEPDGPAADDERGVALRRTRPSPPRGRRPPSAR